MEPLSFFAIRGFLSAVGMPDKVPLETISNALAPMPVAQARIATAKALKVSSDQSTSVVTLTSAERVTCFLWSQPERGRNFHYGILADDTIGSGAIIMVEGSDETLSHDNPSSLLLYFRSATSISAALYALLPGSHNVYIPVPECEAKLLTDAARVAKFWNAVIDVDQMHDKIKPQLAQGSTLKDLHDLLKQRELFGKGAAFKMAQRYIVLALWRHIAQHQLKPMGDFDLEFMSIRRTIFFHETQSFLVQSGFTQFNAVFLRPPEEFDINHVEAIARAFEKKLDKLLGIYTML